MTKKHRTDYAAFKVDVARLHKHLQDFEHDLKEHTMQAVLELLRSLLSLHSPPADDARQVATRRMCTCSLSLVFLLALNTCALLSLPDLNFSWGLLLDRLFSSYRLFFLSLSSS